MIDATDKTKLLEQATREYEHGLAYRQKREASWTPIDDLYYGKKKFSIVTKANIHVPKMQATIDTFVAKIDDSPDVNLLPREEGDKPSAFRSNAHLKKSMSDNEWEMIDLLTKKEAALYGRTIVKKWSTNESGFTDYIEPVDVLDFVIDPLAGGLFPMKNANYMGQDNIIRSVYDLTDEVYDQAVVERLKNHIESDRESDNRHGSKSARRASLKLSDATLVSDESIKLIEWYTTFRGERYMVLFSYEDKVALRIEKLVDLYGHTEFPFSSWALFPRLSEFWTPGLGELIKEPNIVQNILLSQILDNNAFRNYGMMAYDTNLVVDPSSLSMRPKGLIAVDGAPKGAIENIAPPAIGEALSAYKLVDNIFAQETGVTNDSKGTPNSKRMSATEFSGVVDAVADRFFTSNKTYKFHMRRIVKLWLLGASQNMTKAQSIRVLGAKGVEFEKVSAKDVAKEFDLVISTGKEEESNRNIERDRFAELAVAMKDDKTVNQRMIREKLSQNAGLTDDEVERLLNPDMEGDWEILAEAASENELMLKKYVEPNTGATSGHIQRHMDFVSKHGNVLSPEQKAWILRHANAEIEFAAENMEGKARELIEEMRASQREPEAQPQAPAPAPQQFAGAPQGMPQIPVQANDLREQAAMQAPPNINI